MSNFREYNLVPNKDQWDSFSAYVKQDIAYIDKEFLWRKKENQEQEEEKTGTETNSVYDAVMGECVASGWTLTEQVPWAVPTAWFPHRSCN